MFGLLLGAPACAQEIASTDVREVCVSDGRGGSAYSRAHRHTTIDMKKAVAARDGLSPADWHMVEFDHRVPLCLGGADSVANMWAQPLLEARMKDRLEAHACRSVCAGRIPLATAQAWFTGDWRAAYREQFGREP